MSIVAEYNFFLDSKYRTGGGNPNPQFALKKPIVLSNPNHHFVAQIKSCDIPFSFKSLIAPFNTLRVRYQEGAHDTTGTITIQEGNYSLSNLLKEFKATIQDFMQQSPHTHLPQLNFQYDNSTGKCSFEMTRVSGSDPTALTFYWSDPNKDFLAEFFGYTGALDTIVGYDAVGDSTSVNNISEINVNASPVTAVYIRSSSLSQPANNEEFMVEFASSVSDILLKVPVNVPYGSWILYSNPDFEVRITNNNIDVLSFYLTHLSYDVISLAGVHWRAHLYIKEIKPPHVEDMERAALEAQMQIQQMQSIRDQLVGELEGLRDSLVVNDNETGQNVDELKQELLQEVQQNRDNYSLD